MLALLAATLLLAETPPAAQPTTAVIPMRGTDTTEGQRAVWAEHVAQELRNAGVKVVSSRDIETMLGAERQKQMLGCSDEASACLAELSAALGADYTVTGDVSKVAGDYRVDVGVVRGSSATRIAGYTEVVSNEAGVLRALSRAGWRMGSLMLARAGQLPVGVAPEAVTHGDPPPARGIAWLPAAVAAASLVTGTLLVSKAFDNLRQLDPVRPISIDDANRYRDEGKTFYAVGATLIVVGAAAAAVSGILFFAGGGQPRGVQLSAIATPYGAAVALAAPLP